MWVFGYGSLMTDGWEDQYGCIRRVVAELWGYRRVFNKASVLNWGTQGCPCPTLNLEPDAGAVCVGIAFEFQDARRAEVEAYLVKREGKNFKLRGLDITLQGIRQTQAMVPLYTGKNILPAKTMQELVASIRQAHGTSGACSDYVEQINEQLAKLGIADAAVTKLSELLQSGK